MAKIKWKPGNMLYPLPAVMVSCGDDPSNYNIITIAWTGTICTNPPMTYVSIRPERHSHEIIKRTGAFVINLTSEELLRATDYCGVKSGRDENKAEKMNLTMTMSEEVKAPRIEESPVNILCEVTEIKELGSHDMFMAKVVGVYVDDVYMDDVQKFHLDQAKLVAYSHGVYYSLGQKLGTFGYSVSKKIANIGSKKANHSHTKKVVALEKSKKIVSQEKSKKVVSQQKPKKKKKKSSK